MKSLNIMYAAITPEILHVVRRRAPEKIGLLMEEQNRLRVLGAYEQEALSLCYCVIAGTDEAGRGPLAGPLVAGAVVFKENPMIAGLTDSKKVTPEDREEYYRQITQIAKCWGIGTVTAEEIDSMNPHRASLCAMHRAVEALGMSPEFLLVDGKFKVPTLTVPQRAIVKGDGLSYSLAAASILAKVTRDHMMDELDREYPQYGFSRHKGYGTEEHLEALRSYGPCPHHRQSFAPVRDCGKCRETDTATPAKNLQKDSHLQKPGIEQLMLWD